MKKQNVIVFDVDNTIIKGNITFFFMRKLVWLKPKQLHKMALLLLRGTILTLIHLPRIVKNTFNQPEPNLKILDKEIQYAIGDFHNHLFNLLASLKLEGKVLEQYASTILNDHFWKKVMYKAAFEKLKEHLQKPNTIIVLASGGINELVQVFYKYLCERLAQEDIVWQERFFAVGSVFDSDLQKTVPCVGSNKNLLIEKILKNNGHTCPGIVNFVYSDNKHMADLPLFLNAVDGGVLIQKRAALYNALPANLVRLLIFRPAWR